MLYLPLFVILLRLVALSQRGWYGGRRERSGDIKVGQLPKERVEAFRFGCPIDLEYTKMSEVASRLTIGASPEALYALQN